MVFVMKLKYVDTLSGGRKRFRKLKAATQAMERAIEFMPRAGK
ncbi:hypothetical protein CLV80_103307 [Yoonia maritima]|uniref:Uncharacterized protein n=1 Tax=Yoonia maritima TaxID=1435347 RepID=A0A2T0W1Y4_9RHOB|nr:hypothetical protein CLV80_103307 [Yoonia maritima]